MKRSTIIGLVAASVAISAAAAVAAPWECQTPTMEERAKAFNERIAICADANLNDNSFSERRDAEAWCSQFWHVRYMPNDMYSTRKSIEEQDSYFWTPGG